LKAIDGPTILGAHEIRVSAGASRHCHRTAAVSERPAAARPSAKSEMIPTRTPPAERLRLVLRTQPRSVSPRSSVEAIRCALFLLLALFSLPVRAGALAQFRTIFGDIEVELYDQDKPATVQNFIRYVQSGLYTNMFCHRYAPGFVMQGGGYFLTTDTNGSPQIAPITKFPAVRNEFNLGRRFSNVFGTIAMAKMSGDPNSASSEWFFNLADNSTNLDNQNGGFTVFGHLVAGTNILNQFTNLYLINIGSPFDSLPVLRTNATFGDLFYVDISMLNIQVRSTGGGAREISWNSVSNSLNHVEFTTNFPPSWQTLTSTNGTGNTLHVVDNGAADPHRFYRVRVEY
jgi:cyclophilin family peptidyl-prolyl cis-trans isomerase